MQRVLEITHAGVLVWRYFSAAGAYLATGSTAEGDAFFAGLEATNKDDPEAIAFHQIWAREMGDFALAVRLDEPQPYYDSGGNPRWAQDFTMAIDDLGSGDFPGMRASREAPADP